MYVIVSHHTDWLHRVCQKRVRAMLDVMLAILTLTSFGFRKPHWYWIAHVDGVILVTHTSMMVALMVPVIYSWVINVTATVCAVIGYRKCHVGQHILIRGIPARFLIWKLAHGVVRYALLREAQHALPRRLYLLMMPSIDLARMLIALSLWQFEFWILD